MVNKQDFENYKAELQITIGNKITDAINKLNEAITVKLESNKDEIIQSLRNEVSWLQNRIDKLESQVRLLQDTCLIIIIKLRFTAASSDEKGWKIRRGYLAGKFLSKSKIMIIRRK